LQQLILGSRRRRCRRLHGCILLQTNELISLSAAGGHAEQGEARPAASQLQLAIPGVTLPLAHTLYIWAALVLSLAVHEVGRACCHCTPCTRVEAMTVLSAPNVRDTPHFVTGHEATTKRSNPSLRMRPKGGKGLALFQTNNGCLRLQAGHALAAAAEDVRMEGAGLTLTLFLPTAYVVLDEEDLGRLGRQQALRIACAGAWHNAVLATLCWACIAGLAAWGSAATQALQLALAYTASVSAALGLLNMAPVHYLDGEKVLRTLLLGSGDSPTSLPQLHRPASSSQQQQLQQQRSSWPGASPALRRLLAQWLLHLGTVGLAAVALLHVACLKWCSMV
jgi:hypothetical protein